MVQANLNSRSGSKRQSILENAVVIFARDGYSKADVQVIADQAGVGKGTVYRHFGNKEQLFWAASQHSMDELDDYVRARVLEHQSLELAIETMGAGEFLCHIASVCAEYYQSHPDAIEILIQSRMEFRETVSPIQAAIRVDRHERLTQLITKIGESGAFLGWDVQAVSNAFADLFYGSLVNGYLSSDCVDLVQRVTTGMQVLLSGILQPQPPPLKKPKKRRLAKVR